MPRWDILGIVITVVLSLALISMYVHFTKGADAVMTVWVMLVAVVALVMGMVFAIMISRGTTQANANLLNSVSQQSKGAHGAAKVESSIKLEEARMMREQLKHELKMEAEAAKVAAQEQKRIEQSDRPSWRVEQPKMLTDSRQSGLQVYD